MYVHISVLLPTYFLGTSQIETTIFSRTFVITTLWAKEVLTSFKITSLVPKHKVSDTATVFLGNTYINFVKLNQKVCPHLGNLPTK